MQDHLAIHERHVRSALHGGEVALPLGQRERRARQLAIDDLQPILAGHGVQEDLQVVRRHLVAESPTAAMEHHGHLVRLRDAQRGGEAGVDHVLGPGNLDLEVVISGAQCADLPVAALNGTGAHGGGIGTGQAAALLCALEVFLGAVTVADAPARPLLDHLGKL